MENFDNFEPLGKGSYSEVYKVTRKQDNKVYALKKVSISNLASKEQQNALNEVRILASIKHTNVIAFKEAFIDDKQEFLCLVLEYADGADLYQKIKEKVKQNEYFEEEQIWRVLIHVLRGLKQLHDLKIMHRDLKSANVFLTTDGIAKLGDMNVSKTTNTMVLNHTQTGTPYYASPEVWNDQVYGSKSDIWSLGCVIYEMCTLKPPFRAKNFEELYKKIAKGSYSRIPKCYSNELSGIIKVLLKVNPEMRPSCDKLLSSYLIRDKIKKYGMEESDESSVGELLKTIMFKDIGNLQNSQMPDPQYGNLEYLDNRKSGKLKSRSKSPIINFMKSKEKMNRSTNDPPSYLVRKSKNNKSPTNRCLGKDAEAHLYESPYQRISRKRNDSKTGSVATTGVSTPLIKNNYSRLRKKPTNIQTTVDEVVSKIKTSINKGNILEQSHKLQSLKKILNRKGKAHRNKSRVILNESNTTSKHNTTEVHEQTKRKHRPDSDISFPRIPGGARQKYNIDKEKLKFLKSQRDKKQDLLKLEQSRTKDNILLLNSLQLRKKANSRNYNCKTTQSKPEKFIKKSKGKSGYKMFLPKIKSGMLTDESLCQYKNGE
ncbi:unnamed protein product [Moneuplotes crassus]|uniref:non-specific serine/threonine protein kinase n=1 Tax=Euplotes crassus TaxID=5936 RepID=A0AAD1U5R8_EUPCR|nr:unnamed protein product [Moneuplotes crassus]